MVSKPIMTVCLGEPPTLAVGETVIKFGTPLRTVAEDLKAYFGNGSIRVYADKKNDHKSVVLLLLEPEVKFIFHPRWHRLILLTLNITDQTEVHQNQTILLSRKHKVRNNPSDFAKKLDKTLQWEVQSQVYFIKHGTSRLVFEPDCKGTDPAVVSARMEELAKEFEEEFEPAGSPCSSPYPSAASSIEIPGISPCTSDESFETASEGSLETTPIDPAAPTDDYPNGFLEIWNPLQRMPDGDPEEFFSPDVSSFSPSNLLESSLVLRKVILYTTDMSPRGKVMRIDHRSRRTVFITMNPSRQKGSKLLSIEFGSHYEGVQKTLGDADENKQGENPFNEEENISIYEYHNLGVDFGYNAENGKLKTVILHTCYPGHVDFKKYSRCIFRIEVPEKPAKMTGVCSLDTFSRASTIRRLPADRSGVKEKSKSLCRLGCIFELLDDNRIAKVSVGA